MSWLGRTLQNTASESQKGVVLGFCLVALSVMCIVVVWQAQIIADQRSIILWLEKMKFVAG
jgi:hypothetical protein